LIESLGDAILLSFIATKVASSRKPIGWSKARRLSHDSENLQMSFQLRCPCGTILRSTTSFAGKTVTCPKCQTPLQVKSKPAEENLSTDTLPSAAPDTSGSNWLRDCKAFSTDGTVAKTPELTSGTEWIPRTKRVDLP
jgi:phage FluMu protein Com